MRYKVIPGYPNYKISKPGKVRRVRDNYLMTQILHNSYYEVCLTHNKKSRGILVSRLVAMTYLENPDNLPIVDHIDNNKLNNHVSNLRWVSVKENVNNWVKDFAPKRAIRQYSLKGKFIKEWACINDILAKYKTFKRHPIGANLNNVSKSSYGYVWKYKDVLVKKPVKVVDPNEKFAPIKKFENTDLTHYSISKKGNVKNSKGLVMAVSLNTRGYVCITLTNKKNGKKQRFCIHRLVATTFITNEKPKKYIVVNHLDENKLNNCVDNLEWCTVIKNNIHSSGIKINMIDPETDKVVKKFKCINDANRYLKISIGSSFIRNSCKNNTIYSDHRWERDN